MISTKQHNASVFNKNCQSQFAALYEELLHTG